MAQPTPSALLAAKNLTLAALRAQNPALADQVQALLRQSEQARLVSLLEDLPAEVVAKVAVVDLSKATGDVVAYLCAHLTASGVAVAQVTTIGGRAAAAQLGTSLRSNQPVTAAPAVAKQIAAAHVQEVTTLAALTGAAATAVAKAAPATTALDDTAIAKLVTSKAITDAQGKALGLSAALYALTDQSSALATAIQSASFAQLGGKPPASTADLAKLGPADWTAFLTSSKAPLPAGATPETAGAALARRFAAIEPNVAVFARLPQTTADQLTESLTALAPLVALNAGKSVVGADFGQLVTTGLTADQIAAAETTQGQLRQLSSAYPGLGLAALLDDPKTDAATKVGAVDRLVGLVQQAGAQLGTTQVLRLDLSQGSADIATLGLANLRATAGEQTAVLAALKAYQRVTAVTKDIDVMHTVVGAGFTSAHGIARLPLETFTQASALDAGSARGIWEASRVTMADTSLATGAILDATSPQHQVFGMSNQPPSVVQYLAQLPGYQQLFGSLSFCDCEECQSIIGPAAYFVDLMTYIDKNLRNQFTTPGNPLDLQVRRPDLWTLPLTCANTNTLVPALDIVDQILENYIAQQVAPGSPALDLACVTPSAPNVDRSAVQTVVYQQTLFQGEGSFKQPFCLPLARIASYLPALGSSQAAVAAAVGASAQERAEAELGISSPEWAIITTPASDITVLSTVYAMTFTQAAAGAPPVWVPPASSPDASGPPDAAVLGPAMGLSRADLGLVVQSRFVSAGGAAITIVGSVIPGSGAVQNNVELVNGLTVDALDRMHRFTRMVGKTGWAVLDLDLVLTTLGDTTLGAAGVENVAQLHALQGRFGLAIADLCALVGLIPPTPPGAASPYLFDQLFNAPLYVASSGPLPQPSLRFFHPSFLDPGGPLPSVDTTQPELVTPPQTIAQAIAQTLPRLLMGLGIGLGDLEVLIRGLSAQLAQESSVGFNPDDPTASKRYFVLSADNLTLLYRHARLAKLLGASIDNLFQLLGFLGLDFVGPPPPTPAAPPAPGQPKSLANLLALVDLWDWWQASSYALDDVAVAIGQPPRKPATYLDPGTVAQQVVADAAKALTFTDTVFSAAQGTATQGTTEQGSSDLLASLSTGGSVPPLLQQSSFDGSWSLLPSVSLSAALGTVMGAPVTVLTIPSTATVTPAGVLAALQPYATSSAPFADTAFATALGTTQRGADDILASLAATPAPAPNSGQALLQPGATAGTWTVLPGVNLSVVTMPVPPTATVSPVAVLAALSKLSPAPAATFTGSALAAALGTTQKGADDFLASLSGVSSPPLVQLQSAASDTWSVVAGANLGPKVILAVPPTATVTTPATPTTPATTSLVTAAFVLGVLEPYLPSEVLTRSLGTAFAVTTGKVVALAALAGQSLTAPAIAAVVRNDPGAPVTRPLANPPPANPPPPDALTTLVAALLPLSVIFSAPIWNAPPAVLGPQPPPALAPIDFVRTTPSAFGPPPLLQTGAQGAPYVLLGQLRALSVYARFAQRQLAASPPGLPADLQTVLTKFAGGAFSTASADTTALANVLGVPVGMATGLTTPTASPPVALPPVAAHALDRLDRAAQLASTLGVDGATLGALATNDYGALSKAADALDLAISARYPDPKTQATKLNAAEQPIRAAKRDALADYLINTFKVPASSSLWAPYVPVWSTLDDLYEYFLIDVATGGCTETSWLVSATMSAQLYVYRTIMNLEHNGLPPSSKSYLRLVLLESAAEEWEWRQNYRVWQANREVFLWPENYLDPDLRDDMTPLFQDLQSQILQSDIDDQSVVDGYGGYLAGFDEVASLTIAGAYHDVVAATPTSPATDVLHLFGVTSGDPPTFYYRTCQNLIASEPDGTPAAVWSPWQKINVQITAQVVSPVVYSGRLHAFWVDINTKSVNQVQGGNSNFTGFLHTMRVHFTTLRQDGTWTAPQQVTLPADDVFGPGPGQVQDLLRFHFDATSGGVAKYDPLWQQQADAIDGYTVSGANWDRVWLTPTASALELQGRNFQERLDVDLFGRRTTALVNGGAPPDPSVRMVNAANTPGWTALDDAVTALPGKLQGQDVTKEGQLVSAVGTTAKSAAAAAASSTRSLWFGYPAATPWPKTALANAIIDERRLDVIEEDQPGFKASVSWGPGPVLAVSMATIPGNTELLAVPGSEEDALLQMGNDILLLQGSVTNDASYVLRRLGTTLAVSVAQTLFENGLPAFLSLTTQTGLTEAALPMTNMTWVDDRSNAGAPPFDGPLGVYYWELFFHTPFLIANALSSQGQFEAAQKWYQYIFDPTSSEVIDLTNVPPADQAHRALDRVWRFVQFRGLDVPTMRDILTDPTTIALYKGDPFNPWAIARNRISAFQKAIVMKYVDNLLDWADSLFTQFTMESVNEALMLYIMASDILGPRPTDVGDCGVGDVTFTYAQVEPLLKDEGEFLVELETTAIGARSVAHRGIAVATPTYTPAVSGVAHAVARSPLSSPSAFAAAAAAPGPGLTAAAVQTEALVAQFQATPPMASPAPSGPVATPAPAARTGIFGGLGWNKTVTASWGPALGNATTKTKDGAGGRAFAVRGSSNFAAKYATHGHSVMRQVQAFCVPPNAQLLAYWDRVSDRLYKVRNCMDINGNLRQLALFAPPINPMDLVAMEAEGLSLQDVLGTGNGDLPPYRFLYLIDRAKAYAATLGSFGSALLSALEKKDGEALNQLRLTQQLNLSQAMLQSRQMEIDAANASYDAVTQQLASAQYRSGYYAGLIATGNNGPEAAESTARNLVHSLMIGAATDHGVAAVLKLLPQIGSPFAMKYGGVETGGSATSFADVAGMLAGVANAAAAADGLQASFARRNEGWQNQKQLADYDVQVLTQQQTAAQIRVNIATNALTLQQTTIDQTQEFLDRTRGKFTNLGLYTWLASTLQSFYRGAYQNALALANLAQQAFQFERGDYTSPGLSPPYWNATYTGLLAGEQLQRDLQALERRFIETNYRTLEIDQPFALSQVDAGALLDLRETGQCTFTIGEAFFDLFYPGHYKRRIKAVRLTIPCITGPYVNVGATLELTASWVRTTTSLGDASQPLRMPPTRTVTIATSTAQNDAGVFELSFRDERYMPFEGLGAVSQWQITLPKVFRQFDYQTINDVIVSISYEAEQDGVLRAQVESQLKALKGSILNYFSNNTARRLLSLRQDFSSAFTRLLRSPAGTAVTIELSDRNFPFFLRGMSLRVTNAVLLLRTSPNASATGFQMTIDATAVPTPPPLTFAPDPGSSPLYDGLPFAQWTSLTAIGGAAGNAAHTLTIASAGGLTPKSPPAGDVAAVDAGQLPDILLYIEYTLGS